jgi:MoxR-like ATPase
MREITGLVGREPLVEKVAQEVRKGRHVLLTGPVGVGKSSVLEAVLERLERRRDEPGYPVATGL